MNKILFPLTLILCTLYCVAQKEESFVKRMNTDTSGLLLNMDAVYNRPFIKFGKFPVGVGGYVEANTTYFNQDGEAEGLSFQLPRFTLMVSSRILDRIKLLGEVDFVDGGREVDLVFAAADFEFHPLINLRGGIITNPIGSFNQNHDGPKYEFVDRPISSTTIIPATWSNPGFGLYGKYTADKWAAGYEVYVSNGFDDAIINNGENRTWMPATKEREGRFEESFNGIPMYSAKAAFRYGKFIELGLSWMGGVYNQFELDGLEIDEKRRVDFFAIDFNSTLPGINTFINGELVLAKVDVPSTYSQQFGSEQRGAFIDIVQPILRKRILGWDNASLNFAIRGEYGDYNVGEFNELGDKISDEIKAVVPAISFRPSPNTVMRINYRYQWQRDILGNPDSKTSGFQLGIATYF